MSTPATGRMSVPELFDTHAHLHVPEFADDLPAVLERARAAGVHRLVTIGTDVATTTAALALAERIDGVWSTAGIHPHDAGEADEAAFAEIERLATDPRIVAIGEIGLDFFRNLSPRPAQERVGEVGGVMHCFSGDVAIARRCLDLGLVISLAGPVTYPNARALPEVARFVPGDRLVVETDCPFLPPQGHRGRRNEPAYLALTAARVAGLRGESLDTLGLRTSETARRLFRVG